MIQIPKFAKKHLAYAFLAAGAISATLGLRIYTGPAGDSSPSAEAVTMAGYRSAAAVAVAGFKLGDISAAEDAVENLTALVVPKEGMGEHLTAVSVFASYRDALRSDDQEGISAALSRLRELARQEAHLELNLSGN
jgi:hypothetical protein